MSLTKIVKSQARRALSGFRGRAAAILMVVLLLWLGLNLADAAAFRLLGYDVRISGRGGFVWAANFVHDPMVPVVCGMACLARLLLLVPMSLGIVNWHLELTDRRALPVSGLFWPYESRIYFRSIGLKISLLARFLVYGALIWWAPAIAMALAADFLLPGGIWEMGPQTYMAVAAASVPFLILLWAFMGRYDVARVLLCDKYRMTVGQALRTSVRVMKGNKWLLLRFKLSFLWWWVPEVLLVSGYIWISGQRGVRIFLPLAALACVVYAIAVGLTVIPYYRMSHTMLCRYFYEAALLEEDRCAGGSTAAEDEQCQEEPCRHENPLDRPIVTPGRREGGEEKQNDQKYYL